MTSWLPESSMYTSRQSNDAQDFESTSQPATSASNASSEQPPVLPPLQYSLSPSPRHSQSSAFAGPALAVSTDYPIIAAPMPVSNTSASRYPSRNPSPSPISAPPSAYPSTNAHYPSISNPGSRRQTPSPGPSRTPSRAGSLGPPPPSIVYSQSTHSPHSSLSHNSTQSHQSYGASSVITRDTAISAISGTTATSSGSAVEQAVPPVPVYILFQQQQQQLQAQGLPNDAQTTGARVSQASTSSYVNSQAHQSYASSSGQQRRSAALDVQIPRFDKDLPEMPSMDRPTSGLSRTPSSQTNRSSLAPSLTLNGSPHHPALVNGGGSTSRQSRSGPSAYSGPHPKPTMSPATAVSPSISQQSTATSASEGTSATVSSTGATTANSTPDPNGAGQSLSLNSPHASLSPHRSSSSMRNRANSATSPRFSISSSKQQHTGQGRVNVTTQSTPSLVPSVGEEPDSFHVRSTYAQLEVSGVKGDGYEEGVERTRAARTRLASNVSPNPSLGLESQGSVEEGNSPVRTNRRTKSQLLADQAIADENEKKRDLDPKELQVLGSVDRYVF